LPFKLFELVALGRHFALQCFNGLLLPCGVQGSGSGLKV